MLNPQTPACPRGALPHHTFISCVFPGLPHLAAPTPLAPRLLLPACPTRPCSLFTWFLSSLFCSVGLRPAGPSADGILVFCPSHALCRITHHLCFPWAPISPARCPHCCPRWSPSPGWQSTPPPQPPLPPKGPHFSRSAEACPRHLARGSLPPSGEGTVLSNGTRFPASHSVSSACQPSLR